MSKTNDWKKNTCEICKFRVEAFCRKFPPTMARYSAYYPRVKDGGVDYTMHEKACSQYEADLEATKKRLEDLGHID